MHNGLNGAIVGTVALAGATFTAVDAQALPFQPMAPAMSATGVEPVFLRYRYGYGCRRPFLRFGYRFRRPFLGYRRFGYGGYRRFGYGYRRF